MVPHTVLQGFEIYINILINNTLVFPGKGGGARQGRVKFNTRTKSSSSQPEANNTTDSGDNLAHSHSNCTNSFSLHHLTFSGEHTDLVTHKHTLFCSLVSVHRAWTSAEKKSLFF